MRFETVWVHKGWTGLALVAGLAVLAAPTEAATDVTVELFESEIHLERVDGTHQGPVTFKVGGQKTPAMKKPVDSRETAHAGVSVEFGEPYRLGVDDEHEYWQAMAIVGGLEPGTSVSRFLSVEVPPARFFLAITYTAPELPAAELTVQTPPEKWRIGINPLLTLQAAAEGQDIELEIVNSTLQDSESAVKLGADVFSFCGNPPECGAADLPVVPAGTVQKVFVKPELPAGRSGSFSGDLVLGAAGTDLTQTIKLEIFASSWKLRAFGVLCILAGVFLGWWATIFVQHRAGRIRALLPAAAVQERASQIDKQLEAYGKNTGASFSVSRNRLAEVIKALAPERLVAENLIPSKYPMALKMPAVDATEYEKRLAAQSDVLAIVAVVIEQGVQGVLARWDQLGGNVSTGVNALKDMDALAAGDDSEQVSSDVQARLQLFEGALSGAPATRASKTAPAAKPATTRSLRYALNALNTRVWILWAAVTTVVGWAALIQPNFGFGSPSDMVACFLWGLGVQAVGQQLSQLTPSGLMTSLKVEIPKS